NQLLFDKPGHSGGKPLETLAVIVSDNGSFGTFEQRLIERRQALTVPALLLVTLVQPATEKAEQRRLDGATSLALGKLGTLLRYVVCLRDRRAGVPRRLPQGRSGNEVDNLPGQALTRQVRCRVMHGGVGLLPVHR